MESKIKGVTAALADLLHATSPLDDCEILWEAQLALLDYLASSMMMYRWQPQRAHALAQQCTAPGASLLLGQNRFATAEQAAFYNGFLGHFLDLDDVSSVVRGHPSTVILPTLLALLPLQADVSGKRFFTAYAIGVEVMARFARAVGKQHYERGFHNTSTLGVLAGAAAGTYLLSLDAKQITAALGFAAAQSGGLRANFGSEAKPLQAGFAAQKAVQSVQLAQASFTAGSDALGDGNGFLTAYGDAHALQRASLLTQGWGESWSLVRDGLWHKVYPFCSACMHTADAVQAICCQTDWQRKQVQPENIEKIEIIFPPGGDAALVYSNPQTGKQGQFSCEYVAALGLSGLGYGNEHFTDAPVDAKIRQLLAKCTRTHDADILPAAVAQPAGRFTVVRVELRDGSVYRERIDVPHGSPGSRLKMQELRDKLQQAVQEDAEEVVNAVIALPLEQSCYKLLNILAGLN